MTGGGGYIGSILVPYLLKRNYKVTVLDRFFFGINYPLMPSLTIIKEDSQRIKKSHLKGVDCVIDLVAIANDVSGDYFKEQTIKTNYLSRVKTAKLAKLSGVKQYILPSSASVYGFKPTSVIVDEKTNPNPLTHYSRNNLLAEKGTLDLCSSSFKVNIMRQGTIFGYSPRLRLDLVVNSFVYNYLKNKHIYILRDGKQNRPFLHIKDTVRFMEFLINNNTENFNGETFNIGDDKNSISINHLKKIFDKAVGHKVKFSWYGEPDYRSYILTFKKINDYGFKCKFDLEYGIKELLKKLKKFESSDINYTLKWYKNLEKWNEINSNVTIQNKVFI